MTTVIDLLSAAGVECYNRAQWGSPREADGSYARRVSTHPMPAGPADYHFIHITVTGDTDLPADGKAGARLVESYGLSTPPMVSYQDLITNEGRYFQGQNYGVKGTHTVNDKKVPGFAFDLNAEGYATAIMQNVGDEVTDEQVRLAAMICAARELLGLVKKHAPIYPHRMFAWKECPGDRMVARLDDVIRLRDTYVAAGRLPSKEDDMPYRDWPQADKIALVDDVAKRVTQALLDETQVRVRTGDGVKKVSLRRAIASAANAPAVVRAVFDRLAEKLDADTDQSDPDA
jgi:hypothetical protein